MPEPRHSTSRISLADDESARHASALIALAAPGGLLAFAPGCKPTTNTRPDATGPAQLVIDVDSSDTRQCLFPIQQSCSGKDSSAGERCRCTTPPQPDRDKGATDAPVCESLPDAGGLARLSPKRAAATLAKALRRRISVDSAARVRHAVLPGTGGFRQTAPDRRQAILRSLAEQLQRSLIELRRGADAPASASIDRALSGSEEGRLAWRAMREILGSQNHAVLETGGASVQFAVAVNSLRGLAPEKRAPWGKLYGPGSSWKAIFSGMQSSRTTLSSQLDFGQRVCAARKLTDRERTGKYLQRRCHLYAYQSVYFWKNRLHRNPTESRIPGPGCRPPRIRRANF